MGFRVPTTLYSGCHPLPRSEPTDRRRREEPPSRRCRPRGFTPPRRFQPRRRSRAQFPKLALTSPLRPGASQAYSIPLAPLGFALQSFILPESRAALLDSTAFCSLAVSVATGSFRRGNPGDLRPLSPAAPPPGRPVPPRRGSSRDSRTVTRVARGRHLRPPVLRASCPARRPRQSTEASGLAGSMPLRPLRSLAPPGSPYPSTARSRDLRPARARPPGPVLSWDSCPSRACPTTTSGPIDRGRRPAAKPNAPGRPRPAHDDGAWRFDPEA
jgi:hypothetical protein